MLEKLSKMSVREAISVLAGPYEGNRARWLDNATKKVSGVSYRTMKSLWHGEITREDHLAAQAVKRAAEQEKLDEARRNIRSAASIYRSHAAALECIDPDLHREQINALVLAARILGERDSA